MINLRPTTNVTSTPVTTQDMAQQAVSFAASQSQSRFVRGLSALASLALTGCGGGEIGGGIVGGVAAVGVGIWGFRCFSLRRKVSSPGFIETLIGQEDWASIEGYMANFAIGNKHRGRFQRALLEEGVVKGLPISTLEAIVKARGDDVVLSAAAAVALSNIARTSDDEERRLAAAQAFRDVSAWAGKYDQIKSMAITYAVCQEGLDKVFDSLEGWRQAIDVSPPLPAMFDVRFRGDGSNVEGDS